MAVVLTRERATEHFRIQRSFIAMENLKKRQKEYSVRMKEPLGRKRWYSPVPRYMRKGHTPYLEIFHIGRLLMIPKRKKKMAVKDSL